MEHKKDISDLNDIKKLVDSFYDIIQLDQLLGPVFNKVIGQHWSEHLDKMYSFWQTVLLSEHTYNGSPFSKHLKLTVTSKHFEIWLTHWQNTIDKHFEGPRAEEAKWRAGKMSMLFQDKIAHYQSSSRIPLL